MSVMDLFGVLLGGHTTATKQKNRVDVMQRDLYFEMIRSVGWMTLKVSLPVNLAINVDLWRSVFIYHRYDPITYWVNVFSIFINCVVVGLLFYKRREMLAVAVMIVGTQGLLLLQVYLTKRFDIFYFSFLPMMLPALTIRFRVTMINWVVIVVVFVLEVLFIPDLHNSPYIENWFSTLITIIVTTSSIVLGAASIGVAISQVQNRFIETTIARDEERTRRIRIEAEAKRQQIEAELEAARARTLLARNIHDSLGGHLHAAVSLTSMLANGNENRSPSRLQEIFNLLHTSVTAANREMRRAIRVLSPERNGSGVHLEDALNVPVINAQQYGLPVVLTVQGTPRSISVITATELTHVTQEALTNIRKYAQATEAQVVVDYTDPAALVLVIADNGVGLPVLPSGPRADGTGNGLGNMRARVDALGGTLDFPPVEQGVTLWIRIPR